MLDGIWRTPDEIGTALEMKNIPSVSAQIRNIKKIKGENGLSVYMVERRNRSGIVGLSEYRVGPLKQMTVGIPVVPLQWGQDGQASFA